MDRFHLVFDIGGTLLRGAVYNAGTPGGSLQAVRKTGAPGYARLPGASWDTLRRALLDAMTAMRGELDAAGAIASAVVAFPGPVDPKGRVLAAPTLWGATAAGTVAGPDVYPYDLARDLEQAWAGVHVAVLNDVTAAGYRYLRGPDDEFCIVTISTGIGNKVFANGRPLTGPLGTGGEIGHLAVQASIPGYLDPSADTPPCDCGGRGHLGAIASGRGSEQRARARAQQDPRGFGASYLVTRMGLAPQNVTAEALAAAYCEADTWATGVMADALAALAAAFATIHLAIGVSRFVLVGGFAFGLGPRFCEALASETNARCWKGDGDAVSVVLGEPDGLCALLGGGRAAVVATTRV